MVDGKTIDLLRQNLNSLSEELRQLKKDVGELEKRTKIIDGIDSKEFLSFVRFLAKKDQKD